MFEFIVDRPQADTVRRILRRFRVFKEKWGIPTDWQRKRSARGIRLTPQEPQKGRAYHPLYPRQLLLAAFDEQIWEHAVRGASTPLPLRNSFSNGDTFFPLHIGRIPNQVSSTSTPFRYLVGFIPSLGIVGAALPHPRIAQAGMHRFKDYEKCRVFTVLPDARHSDQFALASAHTKSNVINRIFGQPVNFARVMEDENHAFLNEVQGGYSMEKFNAESELPGKEKVLPAPLRKLYGRADAWLLAPIISFYASQGKPLVFRTARTTRETFPELSPGRTGAIVKDISRTARALGHSVRSATLEEKSRWGFPQELGLNVIQYDGMRGVKRRGKLRKI